MTGRDHRKEGGQSMFNEIVRAEIWLQDTLESHKTIDTLAERLGYSTSQVRRRFRQHFGMSPSAYREALRLEKASRLLIHTPLNIRKVASRCGYTNHSAFSRAFLRRFRHSPRHHRLAGRKALAEAAARTGRTPRPRLQAQPPCTAIVAREYVTSDCLPPPQSWPTKLDGYQAPLPGAAAILLLHAPGPEGGLPRRDLGVLVEGEAASGLVIPPSLRLIELTETRCATLELQGPQGVNDSLTALLAELPALGEYYSGDPVRLIKSESTLRLQLPLLDPAEARGSRA